MHARFTHIYSLHRGFFGCLYCFQRGEYISKNKGGSVKYNYLNNPATPRTQNMMLHFRSIGNSETGMFFVSVLEKIPYYDIINSNAIEAFHLLF